MAFLSRLNRPWLHFIVLGVVLYKLQGVFFPEPKPVIGPLNEARLEALQQQWFSSVGRLPTAEQQQRIVEAELDRDMLFQRALALKLHALDTVVYQRLVRNMRFLQMAEGKTEAQMYEEALEMRLHLGDEVVKRRLIQVMEQLLLQANPPAPATEALLVEEFKRRGEELRRPPRYSIEHIYINREREGDVEEIIASIDKESLDPKAARRLSSPFLPGYEFKRQTPDQLARHFGAAFVRNLQLEEPSEQQWIGPIRSTYGMHYVWVSGIEVARAAQFDEVRTQLTRDLESRARTQALQNAVKDLRKDYEVKI